jgi:TolA-binding protein
MKIIKKMNIFLLLLLYPYFTLTADEIKSNQLNLTKYSLQLASCDTYKCIENQILPHIESEKYYLTLQDNVYGVYIVNIKDRTTAYNLKDKYINKFKSLIVRSKFTEKMIKKTIHKNFKKNDTLKLNKNDFAEHNISMQIKKPKIKEKKLINKKSKKNDTLKLNKNDFAEHNISMQIKKPKIKEKKSKTTLYQKALKNFNNRKYKISYNQFHQLFNKQPNDENINFYLGRSAFEIQKYHEAHLAYDRILFKKPNSIRIMLEKARMYFIQKKYENSKYYFEKIKKDKNIPKNVLLNVNKYLKEIDKKIKKYNINGLVLFGLGYDSNINNSTSVEALNNATSIKITDNNYHQASYHQELALLDFNYNFKNNYIFNNSLLLLNKNMFNSSFKDKNVKLIGINPSFHYMHNSKVNMKYELFLNNLWLDNKNFIKIYGISPTLFYKLNKKNDLSIKISHNQKDYKEKKELNSKTNEIKIAYINKYLNNLYLHTLFSYEKEKKDENSNTNINKNKLALLFKMSYIYSSQIIFEPFLSYGQIAYEDKHKIFNDKKENNKELNLGINSTYNYDNKSMFQAKIEYLKINSNIQISEYDKYLIQINYIRKF